jgi:hypothetical protein
MTIDASKVQSLLEIISNRAIERTFYKINFAKELVISSNNCTINRRLKRTI